MDTHYPATLREELYHADGQIDDEVYVYGSFLQSKMYRKGVTCTNCHEPHSLKLKADGNALCATCHLPTKFDTPKHHFHKSGTQATQCVSCHMPSKNYMVIDPRRDHSFRVPRPDLSVKLGTPNACTQCHVERTNEWAAAATKKWYGTDRHQKTHYGEAIYAGRRGAVNAERLLTALAKDRSQPAIARATAGSLMQGYISPVTIPVLKTLLHDPDPLVRVSALNTVDALPPQNKVQLAQHLLTDAVRVVRIEAAQLLADTRSLLPAAERQALESATREYAETLKENADRPDAHANFGNVLVRVRRLKEAEAAYNKAIEIDPNFVPAYINLADLYRAQNRDAEGKQLILQAIKIQPDNGSLHHAYGLLLVREKRLTDALNALKKAIDLDPRNTRYRYVYAVALESAGRPNEGLQILETTHAGWPADRNVLYALISFHERSGNLKAAVKFADTLIQVSPWDQNAHALRKRLATGD
jgi:predicted CXXCH cytochrome family protein